MAPTPTVVAAKVAAVVAARATIVVVATIAPARMERILHPDAVGAAAIDCQGSAMTALRPFDIPFVLLATAITIGSTLLVYGNSAGTARVVVEAGNREWVYSLENDETVLVTGPLGISTIAIHDGKVHFEDSPCANQVCVASGTIERPGQWIACLPNAVFVRIEGSPGEDEPDATSR